MTKNITTRIRVLLVMMAIAVAAVHATGEERVFYAYDASNGLADNSAQIVLCTKTGRMVISTIGHINFFDGNAFSHVDPDLRDAYHIPQYTGSYQMYFDKFHHLWVKNEGMLTCVDLLREQFIKDVPAAIRELGMHKPVENLFGDGEANIWFKSGNTLHCPPLQKSVVLQHPSPVQDVDLYRDSLLLLFHADGAVSVYDYRRTQLMYVDRVFNDADAQRYGKSSELCLVGRKYYQLRKGEHESVFLCYDIDRREWTQLFQRPFLMNSLYPTDSQVYIGSERGYLVYELDNGQITHVETLKLTKGNTLQANINTLAFDRQGGLWIGTDRRGLLYSKPVESPIKVYDTDSPEGVRYLHEMNVRMSSGIRPLPSHANCVFRDSRGWTWTGTNSGLELQKEAGGDIQVLARKDGMTNEVVHSVAEDSKHQIWVGTSYGIARLYIRDGKVSHINNYISMDNVPNESFLNGKAATLADGTVVMQTVDHAVVFNPSAFHDKQLESMLISPKLVSLSVNGSLVEPGMEVDGQVIIDRAATRVKEITVNYDQNSLLLVFSSLNYMRPIQTYYKVRVKGVREYNDWRILSYGRSHGMVDKYGMLRLALAGIAPGRYKIEMQTSMTPTHWPQEPFEWIINVEEPWWRTTGLYIAIAVVLLALLLVNFFFYNRNMRMGMIRNNEEADILRRVRSFAERCNSFSTEVLTPYNLPSPETHGDTGGIMGKEFMEAMQKIVPYVNGKERQELTMQALAKAAGVETTSLYGILGTHLDKNPRLLIVHLRLEQAAGLLRTSNLTVEQVAERCHFVSANFFIATFYHHYRQTPQDYRRLTSL